MRHVKKRDHKAKSILSLMPQMISSVGEDDAAIVEAQKILAINWASARLGIPLRDSVIEQPKKVTKVSRLKK